jgi:hypothetical protein
MEVARKLMVDALYVAGALEPESDPVRLGEE